jgi:hypothetical protein
VRDSWWVGMGGSAVCGDGFEPTASGPGYGRWAVVGVAGRSAPVAWVI